MAYNSDGYIMVDFSEVNFRQANQYIEGLFDRLRKVIGTNKFVLVINANGKTPLPSTVSITNGQYVIESCIFTFSVNSSDMLHIKRNEPDPSSLINDNIVSIDYTWSSYKINAEIEAASGGGTVLSGTLEAGETSITFTNDVITDTALIEIFTLPELWHNSASVNTNTLTITFDAQAADVPVKVRIS